MAAVRVQNYLKKHKIGPLFESLMAQVIQDTPDDPIGYIIKVLQGIHKKQSKQLDNSFNGHLSPRPSSRNSTRSEKKGNDRRSNQLAASWSAGVAQQETRKQESPLKTWTGNDFETVKNKTWSSNKPRDEPQSQLQWNNDTRVPTHDFDELFQMQNGDETQMRASQTSEKYRGVRSWDAQEKQSPVEQKMSFQSGDNDELSRELRLGSRSSATPATPDPATPISPGSRPVKTSRRAVEKHRKELQALLLDGGPGKRRTGAGKHSPEERGTEILERMEDLQYEGVKASQSLTGAKLNKSNRDGNKDVSVTICARCARIIGDKDDVDNLSQATSSDFNSRLFDDITNKNQDFDNIDTASEANENMGFRENNAWSTSDSEHETTPRNNTVSFDKSFDGFPRKESKPIFKSSDNTDDDSPVQTQRSSRSRRSDFDFANTARNSGWRLDDNGPDESDNSDVMKRRSARSQASGSIKGRAWNRNSGNISDDDSTIT